MDFDRMILVKMDITSTIMEAAKRIDEMSILQNHIPSKDLVFKISKNMKDMEEIKLNSRELGILLLIEKQMSVSQIADKLVIDQFTLYKILYGFLTAGLIEKSGSV